MYAQCPLCCVCIYIYSYNVCMCALAVSIVLLDRLSIARPGTVRRDLQFNSTHYNPLPNLIPMVRMPAQVYICSLALIHYGEHR